MAFDDCLGDVDEFVAIVLGAVAEHRERLVGVDPAAGHQDAFCLLDQRSPSECALQAVVLGEALKGDLDRALQFFGIGVDDVGEDSAPGG